MRDYAARVFDDVRFFATDTVRLGIRSPENAYLMADGTWVQVADGSTVENMGIVLPRGAIEAIATAIAEFQGHTSHADTEARVLREWLAIERDRVDAVLERVEP